MTAYGFYVWGAYGFALVLCGFITASTLIERGRLKKRLKGLQK